jgi:triosephosphate isomerase
MAKILFANWKMNPATQAEAVALAKATDNANVVLCPPFPFLNGVAQVVKKAKLGAQDFFWEPSGAFTGEVSAAELESINVQHVIIGHSDRRALGETDEQVAKKVSAAITQKLIPVLCIGETRAQRDAQQTKEVIERQLRSALSLIPADMGNERPTVYITYEPVWAISTNQVGNPVVSTPADAQTVIHYMQGVIRGAPVSPIFLYGGSVNAENLAGFLAVPEIGGALVGGASLRAPEFKKMLTLSSDY